MELITGVIFNSFKLTLFEQMSFVLNPQRAIFSPVRLGSMTIGKKTWCCMLLVSELLNLRLSVLSIRTILAIGEPQIIVLKSLPC